MSILSCACDKLDKLTRFVGEITKLLNKFSIDRKTIMPQAKGFTTFTMLDYWFKFQQWLKQICDGE